MSLVEELALDPWARSHQWRQTPDPQRLQGFSVTLIGAGLGGLNAALMLKRAGIPYTHIEKNAGVGGTWFENRYPGARVDTPSRGYTHIFGANFAYPYPFGPWTENQRYFDWVADEFGLRDDIVFNTEVRVADLGRGCVDVGDRVGRSGRRTHDPLECGDHRRRFPEPAEDSGDRGDARVRRALLAHGALAGGRRHPREAHRGHWYRLHGLPDDPGARFGGRATSSRSSARRRGCSALRATGRRSRPQVTWLDRNFPFHTNFMRLRMNARPRVVALR